MIRICVYNEVTDIQAVDPTGWIDIAEAIENGYIPAAIDGDDMLYNDIDDPESIMHTASDVFELYRQADYVKSFGESSKSESVTPSGESTE